MISNHMRQLIACFYGILSIPVRAQPLSSQKLNFSSPAPHIFASMFGLLQQWPNTFFPFGHSIVSCEIPINTNLYHARMDADMPPNPEWFALDAAMAYSIAGTLSNSHLLTYRTTRAVKCIYFDGASAALNGAGNMDSQMVLIYNNSASIPDDPPFGPRPGNPQNRTSGDPNGGMLGAEYDRADALCAYIRDNNIGGKGWGYEGIVRMNAGFEVIWCDFDSPSARLISHLNVSVPVPEHDHDTIADLSVQTMQNSQQKQLAERPPPKPPTRRNPNFVAGGRLGWLTAGANQYGFSGGMPGRGEARIKIDSCSMFTFFDSALTHQASARTLQDRKMLNLTAGGEWQVPAGQSARKEGLQMLSRRRRQYRASNVSESDGLYMRSTIKRQLQDSLKPENRQCSGIDWHEISRDIVLTYAPALHDLNTTLFGVNITAQDGPKERRRALVSLRELAHLLMMPYYEYPEHSRIQSSPTEVFGLSSPEAEQAYQRCRTQYDPQISLPLSGFEALAAAAINSVLTEICSVALKTFLAVEFLWHETFSASATWSEAGFHDEQQQLEELMAWLGWVDQWTSCEPGCGAEQMCWIPMWPVSFLSIPPGNRSHRDGPPAPPDMGRPNGTRYGNPRDSPYQRPYGPPHGGFPHEVETQLWQPQCVNRMELLYNMTGALARGNW